MVQFGSPDPEGLQDPQGGKARLDDRGQELKILTAKFRRNLLKEYPEPEKLLSIGGQIWGTAGNFSTVIGKAKSKKTFLMSIAIAAASKQGEFCNISSTLPAGQERVLFFDTEQSPYHVQLVAKRIETMSAITMSELNKNLFIYRLREADSVQQRKDIIEYVVNNTKDVGIVFIDGIRDMLKSINDEAESTDLVCQLMKWSSEKNIHLVCALHTNKNDANARGHIGTELMNKSETTLMVEKHAQNNEISIVSPEYTRNIPFEDFAFSVDFDGIPFLVDVPESESKRRKPMPDELSEDTYMDCVFGWQNLSQIEVKSRIMKWFDIGENKSRDYLHYMIDKGYIIETKINGKNRYQYDAKVL